MRLFRLALALCALSLLLSAAGAAAQPRPEPGRGPDPARPEATCSVPKTQSIRGKDVTFDQCYDRAFSHGGTNYNIQTYYTETDSAVNLNRCDASDYAGRCEHAIADVDNGDGDNIYAVAMADEAERAMRFYADRSLQFLPAGVTDLEVFIAEDPRAGGIPTSNSINVLDEWIDNNDVLQKRVLAFHEVQHLIQLNYDGAIGWASFYGEGIARAIEDRVETAQDADTGHLFIPEVNGILGSESNRTADISTISYRSVLWWTWLMDQYRLGGESEPALGWSALRDFYLQLNTAPDQLSAVRSFISGKGSSFRKDFIDYTLALYALRYSPADPRLRFVDAEISNPSVTSALSGHTVVTGGPAFGTVSASMNPRSSRYWEFNPANQCQFIGFSFDGRGKSYGFSVMTVGGGALQKRWTSFSTTWARTVRTTGLDRVVGVVTAVDDSGTVDVKRGCVTPTISIKQPTTAAFEMVGTAASPRQFLVRVKVTGADGGSVAGLTAADFLVSLRKASGGADLPAAVASAAYVQDDYWLLVQAPDSAAGAEDGQFYNLTVALGGVTAAQNSSVLYVERTQDVVVVLDRSGSMAASSKIAAARNAANLLVNELAANDQGGFVAFDDLAALRRQLAPVTPAQRSALTAAINAETPGGATSIGAGMQAAAAEHDVRKNPANACSFVLLSDGQENTAPLWAGVSAAVADNNCAIHTIALGPEANEVLMQQIAAAVPGGSYDYADVAGGVPLLAAAPEAAEDSVGWQNGLSRIYDQKAAQIGGRQRVQTFAQNGRDQEPVDTVFFVDDATDQLVVAVAWQNPSSSHNIQLFDPDGNPVPASARRPGGAGTNEVWTVDKPKSGDWRMRVTKLIQPYFVSPTLRSNYQLYLLIGTPVEGRSQGVRVPIVATLVGPGKPLTGATVQAKVRAPSGALSTLPLYDDGGHGDGEAGDGVYGNFYSATSAADLASDPAQTVDGEELAVVGSYLVTVTASKDRIRREAQGSFALSAGKDSDKDGLPDDWERANGLDPDNGRDVVADPDRDRLSNGCEFQLGTDPRNSDTDGGGESDGSEAPNCQPLRDPLNPADDRVGRLSGLLSRALLDRLLRSVIRLKLSAPERGALVGADIYRRVYDSSGALVQDWQLYADDHPGDEFEDAGVSAGNGYAYLVIPQIRDASGGLAEGPAEETGVLVASADPYAPTGSVLINGGAPATDSPLVTLTLTADDSGPDTDGDPDAPPAPGSPSSAIQMRLSNTPDFGAAQWQPFHPTVAGWNLGALRAGQRATVYVQFRDAAGNIGDTGMAQVDAIAFRPNTLFLPITKR